MLRESQTPVNPELGRNVKQLIREENYQVTHERRSAHREQLIRPVTILLRDEEGSSVNGFTRNISSMGVGVISKRKFEEGQLAVLDIYSLENKNARILSECRWSSSFGEGWFVSGWNFLNIARST